MKRFPLVVIAIAWLAFMLIPRPAIAADNLDTIVSALKESPVYVEPGVPGTDEDTASELQSALRSDDRLVLVMVTSPETYGFSDARELAKQLNQAFKGQNIVAVSAGDQTVAASSIMPSDVASDLMHRATSVSTSSTETLTTFVRNVHAWQADNPQAKASKPKHRAEGSHWFLEVLLVICLATIAFIVWYVRRYNPQRQANTVKLKKSPDLIKTHLETILDLRLRVQDGVLRGTIMQCVKDTEAYFGRYTEDRTGDARIFARHLETIVQVLNKYVDIQDHGRYYTDPVNNMARGKKAITDFATFVLDSCRRTSTASLTDYNVNTNILQAQRYR